MRLSFDQLQLLAKCADAVACELSLPQGERRGLAYCLGEHMIERIQEAASLARGLSEEQLNEDSK